MNMKLISTGQCVRKWGREGTRQLFDCLLKNAKGPGPIRFDVAGHSYEFIGTQDRMLDYIERGR